MKHENLEKQLNSMKVEVPALITERIDQTLANLPQALPRKSLFQRFMGKKSMTAMVVAALLLVPTSTFAYKHYLADEMFGSFADFKKLIKSATMVEYQRISMSLAGFQEKLGEEEFDHYIDINRQLVKLGTPYVDDDGNIDYSKMPPDVLEQTKALVREQIPYQDFVNGYKDTREILTLEEYERYIDARMTMQTMMSRYKAGSGGYLYADIEKRMTPEDLLEFRKAHSFSNEVLNKKSQQ